MSRLGWVYIWTVLGTAAALCAAVLPGLLQPGDTWLTWLVLTSLATLTQLFKTLLKSQHQSASATTSYSPFLIFLFAGVLLLPPASFALLVIVAHLVELLRDRWTKSENLTAWYIQPF